MQRNDTKKAQSYHAHRIENRHSQQVPFSRAFYPPWIDEAAPLPESLYLVGAARAQWKV